MKMKKGLKAAKVKSPVVNKSVGGLIQGGVKAAMKAVGKGTDKVKRGVDKALHYSADQGPKGAPGVTAGGRTSQSAVISRPRVADYTKKRRIEGFKAGEPVGVAGSVLVDSMYDSKKKSKKAPSLGGKRQTEADRRKATLKKVQTPVDTVGGISKPKKKSKKALDARKDKVRPSKKKVSKTIPTIKARSAPTKRRPTMKEQLKDSSVAIDYDQLDKMQGGGKVMKKNMGGSLKAVNNPGLANLPTDVRNRMGYKKGGGKVEYKMGGGKVMGYKKGGPITYRMLGGQVVDNSYD